MKVIKITQNQFFTIKKEKYLLSAVIVLFLIALVLDIVFWGKQKSKTTINGNKIYLPNSKVPLFISVAISVLNLSLILKSLYDYNKIFFLHKSRIFNILTALLLFNFILFVITLIFALNELNECPDGKEFIDELNMCAEICPKGSYLNSSGNCTEGCSTSKNCGENEECINGVCCNMNENKIIDGTCCPNESQFTDENGNQYCCKFSCGGTCCSGDSTMYYCTKNNECALKCGGENCSPDQICYEYPKRLEDTKADYDDKVYKCVTPEKKCDPQETNYYPNAVSNFYGAYNSDTSTDDFGKTVDSFLNSKTDTEAKTSLKPISDTPQNQDNGNDGYICGLNEGSVAQFEQREFNNCSDPAICLQEVSYPTTQLMNAVEGDDGKIICNQFQDPNLTVKDNSEEKGPYPSYYKSYQILKPNKNFQRIDTKQIDFKKKKIENNLTTDSSCETNYYVQDCNKACNPCYIDEDKTHICVNDNKVQYMRDFTTVPDFRCIVSDNRYTCQDINKLPKDERNKLLDTAPKCKDDNECNQLLNNNIQPNVNICKQGLSCCGAIKKSAIPVVESKVLNAGLMSYGSNDGNKENNGCFNQYGTCNLKSQTVTGNKQFCGPSLKPYFFNDAFLIKPNTGKGTSYSCPQSGKADNKPGYAGPLNYVCCDARLEVTDEDAPIEKNEPYRKHYITNLPKNKQYCIGPDRGSPLEKASFSTHQYTFKNNYYIPGNKDFPNSQTASKEDKRSSRAWSYVGFGVDGGGDPGSDMCKVDATKGSKRLNYILHKMNYDNFGGKKAPCPP